MRDIIIITLSPLPAHRCEEAEKATKAKGKFTLPVFVVVCTKLKPMPGVQPVSSRGDGSTVAPHTYTHAHAKHTRTHTHLHIHTYLHTYIYTHTHLYLQTHANTHTHTHTYTEKALP